MLKRLALASTLAALALPALARLPTVADLRPGTKLVILEPIRVPGSPSQRPASIWVRDGKLNDDLSGTGPVCLVMTRTVKAATIEKQAIPVQGVKTQEKTLGGFVVGDEVVLTFDHPVLASMTCHDGHSHALTPEEFEKAAGGLMRLEPPR